VSVPAIVEYQSERHFSLRMAVHRGALVLAAVALSCHFTNYGPLIPLLQGELHASSWQVGLLSTLLYVGIGLTYLLGGVFADRWGARRVLFGSLLLVGGAGCCLPLFPNLVWIVCMRALIGLGSGAAIVAASQAARVGTNAAFGQGVFGGAMQAGAALGLFATPALLASVGWQGAFVAWGLLGLVAAGGCVVALRDEPLPVASPPRRLRKAWHSGVLWSLGLVHFGTLGLGQAIAPWLAVYLAVTYGIPIGVAAMIGAWGLLAGILFRPLGGWLLSRGRCGHVVLLRTGTLLACISVILLALPQQVALLTAWGITLLACGTSLPYAAVCDQAARIGKTRALGSGTAQGVVSVISAPASAFGPPLIGALLERSGGFTAVFGAFILVGLLAITAAALAGVALSQVSRRREPLTTRSATPFRTHDQRRLEGKDLDAYVQSEMARIRAQRSPQFPPPDRPTIAIPGSFALSRPQDGSSSTISDTTIRRLFRAGGTPLVLPVPTPQGSPCDFSDPVGFQHVFDSILWPLCSQLLRLRVRGIYLITGEDPLSGDGQAPDRWKDVFQDALLRFARLLGMPVLIQRGHEQRWQVKQWNAGAMRPDGRRFRAERPARTAGGGEELPALFSTFIAAAQVCAPPSLEAVHPLRAAIGSWLYFQLTSRRTNMQRAKSTPACRYTRDDLLERKRAHMRQREGALLLAGRKPGGKRHPSAAGPQVARLLPGHRHSAGTRPA
jgi:CP family cyanate transporter-like MFS transporter